MTHDRSQRFELEVANEEHTTAYLKLPTHPVGPWKTSRSLRLFDLIGRYDGPDVMLDFDEEGVLVGIEVLV